MLVTTGIRSTLQSTAGCAGQGQVAAFLRRLQRSVAGPRDSPDAGAPHVSGRGSDLLGPVGWWARGRLLQLPRMRPDVRRKALRRPDGGLAASAVWTGRHAGSVDLLPERDVQGATVLEIGGGVRPDIQLELLLQVPVGDEPGTPRLRGRGGPAPRGGRSDRPRVPSPHRHRRRPGRGRAGRHRGPAPGRLLLSRHATLLRAAADHARRHVRPQPSTAQPRLARRWCSPEHAAPDGRTQAAVRAPPRACWPCSPAAGMRPSVVHRGADPQRSGRHPLTSRGPALRVGPRPALPVNQCACSGMTNRPGSIRGDPRCAGSSRRSRRPRTGTAGRRTAGTSRPASRRCRDTGGRAETLGRPRRSTCSPA